MFNRYTNFSYDASQARPNFTNYYHNKGKLIERLT